MSVPEVVPPGEVVPLQQRREEFGAVVTNQLAETSASAVAAQARAQVEARYVVAMQRPRSIEEARVRILKECDRPRFAQVAMYSKPVGGTPITGLSIRFVEAAVRNMGNIFIDKFVKYDDAQKRILGISVTDLETNAFWSADVTVEKTVERKSLKAGQNAISSRLNIYGQVVYLVPATDDETLVKENALTSKAVRTLALRLIPGDIIDEAIQAIKSTMSNAAAKDPDADKKALIDAFFDQGVKPQQLAQYLGHDLDQVVPAELVDLRKIYNALKEGETTWTAVMATKTPETPDGEKPAGGTAEAEKHRRAEAKAKKQPAPPKNMPPAEIERELIRIAGSKLDAIELLQKITNDAAPTFDAKFFTPEVVECCRAYIISQNPPSAD